MPRALLLTLRTMIVWLLERSDIDSWLTFKKIQVIEVIRLRGLKQIKRSARHLFFSLSLSLPHTYAAFRLACRSPLCRFDDDTSSTAQASRAAEGWPSGKERLANRSIILPLCPPRQIADSWILFNSGPMPLGDKAKASLPLRAATLKQQAMITRHSGKAASGKLVWNQHYSLFHIFITFTVRFWWILEV